ncbi:MAG: proline--tRNA ligase [Candidatus Omnitrophica bacterium]|nr:proline--tRNA ligase [Candidatus Omnitrophota bacterium]
MLYSKFFIPTLRENPQGAECLSHRLLLRGGYLYMMLSGIYVYLPLGLKVLEKVSNIVRKHMNDKGAIELVTSHLQPLEIWQRTGRDSQLEEVMIKFKDRRGRGLCLGPTNEEQITEIVSHYVTSYKQLPLILYQIQTKFRDEARPRYGLIRSCEFVMKDAYSFDEDENGLEESYQKMLDAYNKIFKECGLNFIVVEADPGVMGGSISHEFMVPTEIGEDILSYCSKCNLYFRDISRCKKCGGSLKNKKAIEVGHVFKLGDKYSKSLEVTFLDRSNQRKYFVMGCYGIGVSRIISSVIEQNHDKKGIIWPPSLAPFEVNLIIVDPDNQDLFTQGLELEKILQGLGLTVLVDDRLEQVGVKFNDAYLIGSPYILILGKNYLQDKKYELEVRATEEKFSFNKEELINFFKDVN